MIIKDVIWQNRVGMILVVDKDEEIKPVIGADIDIVTQYGINVATVTVKDLYTYEIPYQHLLGLVVTGVGATKTDYEFNRIIDKGSSISIRS
jgi:hypothetical protein